MYRRLIASLGLLAGLVLSAGLLSPSAQGSPAPVPQAFSPATETCFPGSDWCQGGVMRHYSPNAGYDGPIVVFCDANDVYYDFDPLRWNDASLKWGERKLVYEGGNTREKCETSRGSDMDVVWVRQGQEITCLERDTWDNEPYWDKKFDAYGPHKVNDLFEGNCVTGLD